MRILLLEDNPGDARLLSETMVDAPRITASITHATSLDKALTLLRTERFDLALVDLSLPDSDGEPTVDTLLSLYPELPIVVLTGRDDDELAASAMRSGAQDYLVKGTADAAALSASLRYALERHQLVNQVRRLTFVDSLTGLYNRRGISTFGSQMLKLADRNRQQAMLLFADLDDLKTINDTEGHWVGDLALVEAADVLREGFRSSDLTARIGGDEFAVLALMEPRESAADLASRVRERLELRNRDGLRSFELSLSTGFAIYEPESGESLDELVRRADDAMYQEKAGRKATRV